MMNYPTQQFILILSLISFQISAQQFSEESLGTLISGNNASAGCSWSDFNNDGYPDMYITNTTSTNRLFINNGDGTFLEVVEGDVVNGTEIGSSSIWADYDNDGNLDLYVSNNISLPSAPQLNSLYRNNGPPEYTFETILAPPSQTDANYSWSSSWVDFDNDGDLDLHMPDNKHENIDYFYENTDNGEFVSITPSFVTPDVESTGVASWIDYDHDGDQDLFMIKSGRTHPNDVEDARMYHNKLSETGILEFNRVTTADMVTHLDLDFQASWGDYDNDGDMDVYLGNFDNSNYLYRNEGDSLFTQITDGPLVTDNSNTLGSTWGDFDNDGDLDLYVVNTNVNLCNYYQNDGQGNFINLTEEEVGPIVSNISNAQSVANADYNNDGYLDLFVVNNFCNGWCPNAINYLYTNNGGSNNFIAVNLENGLLDYTVVGAKVWVKANINGEDVCQLRHLTGSPTGDRSQDDTRLHFGLGDAEIIDSLIIDWPNGTTHVSTNINVNQFLTYTMDQSTGLNYEEEVNIGLEVYPNPTINDVNIKFNLPKDYKNLQVQLLDANQKLIKVFSDDSYPDGEINLRVSLDNLEAGSYFILIISSDFTIIRPVVLLK